MISASVISVPIGALVLIMVPVLVFIARNARHGMEQNAQMPQAPNAPRQEIGPAVQALPRLMNASAGQAIPLMDPSQTQGVPRINVPPFLAAAMPPRVRALPLLALIRLRIQW